MFESPLPDLSRRILTPEVMDRDDVNETDLRKSLGYLRWVNRFLGGTGPIVRQLAAWSKTWPTDRPIVILDVATGGADLPKSMVTWARRHGRSVRVIGIDRHEKTLQYARENVGDEPWITLLRSDALHLPLPPNSVDYAVSSLFLHHLNDVQVMTVLSAMDKVARRGLIWSDLLRRHRAVQWIRLLSLFANPVVKHDAPVSVLAGFRRDEVLAMRDRLELRHLRFREHFGHRFTLSGQRAGRISNL